jgi:hypothetical protein
MNTSTVVVPSVTPVAPTSVVVPIISGNITVPSSTGTINSPTGPSASSTRPSTETYQSTGAAGTNVVSFGVLILAMFAEVLFVMTKQYGEVASAVSKCGQTMRLVPFSSIILWVLVQAH